MPSPFPGMDPFLEHPAIFPDLHGSLNVYLREALQASLPEPYFAVVNERLWVEASGRFIEPDVDVLRSGSSADAEIARSGVLVVDATASAQPVVIDLPHEELRQPLVEIRTQNEEGHERIVTTIEVLSLSNKTPGKKSRDLYLQKQREVVDGDIHLVEIDLLRSGEHTTLAPRARILEKAGPFDYHVCIYRCDQWAKCYVYANRLDERLPEISIPLLAGDDPVPLDLQAVFARCYDTGPYRRRIRYDPALLEPSFDSGRTEWVRRQLQMHGVGGSN